tara:strand:+ start:111 stop:344 length:234 start_codon:yes stop_codon:yes gene_type:complete
MRMKWFERFMKKPTVDDRGYYCQCCGGKKMRQTTLDEWDPHVFRPDTQRLISDYIPTDEVTERVGMKSEKRKYRGNI